MFKVALFFAREHLKAIDVSDQRWQDSLHCGDPRMGPGPDWAEVAQTLDDVVRKYLDVVDVGQESGSGDVPTGETREPTMAPPHLILVPDSPQLPVQLPPESE